MLSCHLFHISRYRLWSDVRKVTRHLERSRGLVKAEAEKGHNTESLGRVKKAARIRFSLFLDLISNRSDLR